MKLWDRVMFTGKGDPHVYWSNSGRYFGYSECCIQAFLEGRQVHASPFSGTGFLPCPSCHKLPMEIVVDGINSRRVCPTPFPDQSALTEAIREGFYSC